MVSRKICGHPSLISFAMLLFHGCAPTSDLRGVQGSVTFEDQPVASGTIEFTPVKGTKGALTGSEIQGGAYSVPQDHGVHTGGTYKVSIVSMRKTGKIVQGLTTPDGKPMDEYANYIPTEHNSSTKIEVKISDESINKIDFHLKKDSVRVVGGSGEAQK